MPNTEIRTTSPLTGVELPIRHGHHRMPEQGQCGRCDAYRVALRENFGTLTSR